MSGIWRRTVDQEGYVLDEIVQIRRDAEGAKRLLVRLLEKQGIAEASHHRRIAHMDRQSGM